MENFTSRINLITLIVSISTALLILIPLPWSSTALIWPPPSLFSLLTHPQGWKASCWLRFSYLCLCPYFHLFYLCFFKILFMPCVVIGCWLKFFRWCFIRCLYWNPLLVLVFHSHACTFDSTLYRYLWLI